MIAVQVITTGRPPFPASCQHPCLSSTWQRSLLRVAPRRLLIQRHQKHPQLFQWRLTILQRPLCLRLRVLATRDRAYLPLAGLLTLAVAMVVKPARQGCVVLLTGQSSYLHSTETSADKDLRYCGTAESYCGSGCQSQFGNCSGTSKHKRWHLRQHGHVFRSRGLHL